MNTYTYLKILIELLSPVLPKTGPHVTGLQEQYKIDDIIVANCSLPPSRPKANLKWLINDQPAAAEYVLGPWYRVSAERPDAAETILQLSFQATAAHFINGAIKLKVSILYFNTITYIPIEVLN